MSGSVLLEKNAQQHKHSQLDLLFSGQKITDASALISEILSKNPVDYPQEYLGTKRVSDILDWAKKNNSRLTKKINLVFEKNAHIFAALSSGVKKRSEVKDVQSELLFIFENTGIPATDDNIFNLEFSMEQLEKNAMLSIVGVVLGQEYIQSVYAKTPKQNSPQIFLLGTETKYYPASNVIGISLLSLVDERSRGKLDISSFLISCIATGIHDGTHGLAIANKTSNSPLGELATYIAGENYMPPIKSDYFFELWNFPILLREMKSDNFGSKNSDLKRAKLQKSFYLIQFMGPWINSYLNKRGKVDIEQFEVDVKFPEIKMQDLVDYYHSGALDGDGAKLEAQAFCENSGIKDPLLISKIVEVFEKFRDKMIDMRGFEIPIKALMDTLDEVFSKPKIPTDVMDGYAHLDDVPSKNRIV